MVAFCRTSLDRRGEFKLFPRPAFSDVFLRFLVIVIAFCLAGSFARASTVESVLAQANKLESAGQFNQATKVLQQGLKENFPPEQQKQIEFEIDRLHRIRLDYPFTREALFAALQQSVRDLTPGEFQNWIEQGRFDSREIDGKRLFMGSSVANLYFRYPELDARRIHPKDDLAFEKAVVQSCQSIERAAQQQGTPYVLPKRLDVTMTVTADADAAPAGEIIRAWLPIPRLYPYQKDFKIISSSPTIKQIAPAESSIRSVYFEQPAKSGAPTEFTLHYRYTHYGVRFNIDPDKVTAFDGKDQTIARFTRQAPDVVFTPKMKELSEKIAGGEKNPARLAKKFYDWIGSNIHYSFATEYSTIRNISDYCRSHRYGDCGEEAMLYITLCRLNGIPARWQSGWDLFPGGKDIHDWSEIYLAPYGWVPVDPYMGLYSTRYMTRVAPGERKLVHEFFFGGLNQWRMAANCDHCQILSPPKKTFRSDNVDFQRGELEAGNQNIYFNHYHYQLEVKEVPAITQR